MTHAQLVTATPAKRPFDYSGIAVARFKLTPLGAVVRLIDGAGGAGNTEEKSANLGPVACISGLASGRVYHHQEKDGGQEGRNPPSTRNQRSQSPGKLQQPGARRAEPAGDSGSDSQHRDDLQRRHRG